MNCENASECMWLERFGVRVCERMFRNGRCKPIEEDDDEEMPEQSNGALFGEELDGVYWIG